MLYYWFSRKEKEAGRSDLNSILRKRSLKNLQRQGKDSKGGAAGQALQLRGFAKGDLNFKHITLGNFPSFGLLLILYIKILKRNEVSLSKKYLYLCVYWGIIHDSYNIETP